MEHLDVLQSFVRCALFNATPATRHQIERLATALEADGYPDVATKVRDNLAAFDTRAALVAMMESFPEGTYDRARMVRAIEAYDGPRMVRS